MKKKALTYTLAVALLLASLTACGKSQTDQQTAEAEPPQMQATIPEAEATPEVPEQIPAVPEPLSATVPVESDETEDSQTPEETASQEPAGEVKLFEDVNEIVYATGAVNIRASYTAESEKLGSLLTGDAVTRTGTSIQGTEAEGWSRVILSDGSTAYISNKYLSTTKPVQQSQSGQSTNSAQQQTQPASSGGKGDFVPGPGYNRGSVDVSDFVPITGTEGPGILTGEEVIEGWKGIQ